MTCEDNTRPHIFRRSWPNEISKWSPNHTTPRSDLLLLISVQKTELLSKDHDFPGHKDLKSSLKRQSKLASAAELAQQLTKFRDHVLNIFEAGGDYIFLGFKIVLALTSSFVCFIKNCRTIWNDLI